MENTQLFENNNKYGIKDINGEIIIPAAFDNYLLLSSHTLQKGDRVVTELNGKYGVLEADGTGKNWLLEPEYDYIGYPNSITYVVKKGEISIYSFTEKKFIEEGIDSLSVIKEGFPFVNDICIYKKNDKYGVLRIDGKNTGAIFDFFEDKGWEGLVKVKFNNEWGFINENGNFTTDETEAAFNYYE